MLIINNNNNKIINKIIQELNRHFSNKIHSSLFYTLKPLIFYRVRYLQ